MELVYTLDSKSSAFGHEGSSPSIPTSIAYVLAKELIRFSTSVSWYDDDM